MTAAAAPHMAWPSPAQPIALMQFGPKVLTLHWQNPGGREARCRVLPLGLSHLRVSHAVPTPPSALALEHLIETIEDVLMPLARAMPINGCLVIQPQAKRLSDELLAALGAAPFGLPQVEDAFARLADLALGRPASVAGMPDNPEFAIALLIIREAMHHLPLPHARWGHLPTPPLPPQAPALH